MNQDRLLHVYLLLFHLHSGDVPLYVLGEPYYLANGVFNRLPDHLDDLPDLGLARLLRLRFLARWPPAVLAELPSHVVARHRVSPTHLLSSEHENMGFYNRHRPLERMEFVPTFKKLVSSNQCLRVLKRYRVGLVLGCRAPDPMRTTSKVDSPSFLPTFFGLPIRNSRDNRSAQLEAETAFERSL